MHNTRILSGTVTRINQGEGWFMEESPGPHSTEVTFQLCDYRQVTETGFGNKGDLRGKRILPHCHLVVGLNELNQITAWAFYVEGRNLLEKQKQTAPTSVPMAVARSAAPMPKPKPFTHISDEEVAAFTGRVVGNTGTAHRRHIFQQKPKPAWRP